MNALPKSKYRNVRVSVDGILFDSKAEAKRYNELLWLQLGGEVADLSVHHRFPCEVNGQKVTVYEADFVYRDVKSGQLVVEDVKGVRTAVYKLKKKIFEAIYPYKITEIAA
jgi:hypothetical protein